jgi:transposase
MKELYEAIYSMYVYDNMSIREIAFEEGLSIDEVESVIEFMVNLDQ